LELSGLPNSEFRNQKEIRMAEIFHVRR
jgi:hypothetical protein